MSDLLRFRQHADSGNWWLEIGGRPIQWDTSVPDDKVHVSGATMLSLLAASDAPREVVDKYASQLSRYADLTLKTGVSDVQG